MISPRISFKNFKSKKVQSSLVRKKLTTLIKEKNEILKSLSKDYKNNFNHKNLKKFKKSLDFRVIGMGGSSLGAKAIYDFLRHKIKKRFFFIDNLKINNIEKKSPLVMPPDFDELPIPKEIEIQKDINENEFKTLITQDNQEIKSNEKDINKNFEELLLDKIKKN